MVTKRKSSGAQRLLVAILLAMVLIASALCAVADENSEILENRTGRVDLTDMTTEVLIITGDETADRTLVVSIGAGCEIGQIRVENGAYLLISKDAKVGSIQVVNPVDVYLNGTVEDITAVDGAFVFIEGAVKNLQIGSGTYVHLSADTAVEALKVESEGAPSVIEIDERASVASVSVTSGEVTIGGIGNVETVNVTGESTVNVEASITTVSGDKTEIAKDDTASAVYLAEELFTMAIKPFENVVLNNTMKLPVQVADVIGVPVAAQLSVTSSDDSVVSASLDGTTLILERKAEGKAFITIHAEMDGYLSTTASFCVYKSAELQTAVQKITRETEKTNSTVPVELFCGNACNKSMLPGDQSVVSGITAPEGATLSVVSSNPAVAQVSAVSGGSFTITAVEEGMTAITIMASQESTDEVTYTPSVQKILVLVDQPEAVRTQLTVGLPSEKDLTKRYDGTTSITLPEPVVTGIKDGDDVHVVAIACFADSQAGTGKTVNISYHLYGDHANAYISPADVSVNNGTINKRAILMEADAVTREYATDDTRVELENIAYSGVVAGDRVYLDTRNAFGKLSDALAGDDKAVTITKAFLGGEDKANYTLVLPDDVTVTIEKQQVEKPVLGDTQTYNGSELTADIPTNDLYVISGDKETEAGEYEATISLVDQDNYRWADDTSDDITIPYTINSKTLTGNVGEIQISSKTYTGSPLTPAPEVTDTALGETLVKDVDYTLTYSNNTNAGTATVTITGKGNYKGEVSGSFTINPKSLASGGIGQIPVLTFTGSAITPKPTVTDLDRNVLLVEGTDFTYGYTNNVSAGEAYITVTGKGNYMESTYRIFSIGQKSMTESCIIIDEIHAQTYSNSAKTPALTVRDTNRGVTLTAGKDYTVSYTNNTNVGTATATIQGMGSYKGTMSRTFTINKANPTLGISAPTELACGHSITLSASSNSGGAVTWSLGTHTTNTTLSGANLTMGQAGANTINVSIAPTANYNGASDSITITGVPGAPIVNSVSASVGSFDDNNRALVTFNPSVSNPSSNNCQMHYTVARNDSSQGSFVYTNGTTSKSARMAIGSYTVTAYATNEYGTSSKSCTVTVNPVATVPSQSGTASGHDCILTVTNNIPSGTVTGYSFNFTTASGHSGSDRWTVTVHYANGNSSEVNNGNASRGATETVTGLNYKNVVSIVFLYHIDDTHGDNCLGTNMSASISVSIPQNNSQTSAENASSFNNGSFPFVYD